MDFQEGRKRLLASNFSQEVKQYLRVVDSSDWPSCDVLNRLANEQTGTIVNANGIDIKFVTQYERSKTFETGFEQRAFLSGEVQVRPENWHDLLNAFTWLLFPKSKAALNARHYRVLRTDQYQDRSPEGDALTLFDEEGVIVLSRNAELTTLLIDFRWVELFYERREEVRSHMSFYVFGHALLEKTINPYIGMTGKAVIINQVDDGLNTSLDEQRTDVDNALLMLVSDQKAFMSGRELSPLPMLGLPGCWNENEKLDFYLNESYFRPKKNVESR
ncbi:MAG: DUF3025 domain-containing protein [Burkholderiales bacterium]|nr:DUF3025 domain-containing protein [Burkholderiales bacterium]